MTVEEAGRFLLSSTPDLLRTARTVLRKGWYPFAFRQSQECVEYALKALLRASGIHAPKWHDPGEVLARERKLLPDPAQSRADELAKISGFLAARRIVSMYGDEKRGIPAEKLISEEDARRAVAGAEFVIETVQASWRFEGA